jgi:(p)ppGpp synthase/HD superfamily hydrolase
MTNTYYTFALNLIDKAFKGKVDKGGAPYVRHLHRVSDNVPKLGPNEETKTIALLHDLLEDCPEWNAKSLAAIFPQNIVDAVQLLTRQPHEKYFVYIESVSQHSWAKAVKIADLEDNMDIRRLNEITEKDVVRLTKYHTAHRILTGKDL